MLAQLAKENGANVAMLTDFDASGIGLAFELKDITRLGIDLTTIDELNAQNPRLNLDVLKVEERYNGYNHWKQLNNLVHHIYRHRGSRKSFPIEGTDHELEYIKYLKQTARLPDGTEISYINYIKNRRIELNSIMNEMGGDGPRLFWNWLSDKITSIFEVGDYTCAITIPKFVFTPIMSDFQRKLQESLTQTLRTTVDEIELDLIETPELVVTRDKLREIRQTMVDALLEDPDIQKIHSALQKLTNKL